ncbi:MAG TPA: hypothetical protein VF164_00195 [Trueperaceae bacterium]
MAPGGAARAVIGQRSDVAGDQARGEPDTLFPTPESPRVAAPVPEPTRQTVAGDPQPAKATVEARAVPLIDDADFGGEYLIAGDAAPKTVAPATGGLEGDITLVDEYLRRPDIPAIIRAEAVGEVLAMGEERAERALERISERPDRLSRIRRGAYMVRAKRD